MLCFWYNRWWTIGNPPPPQTDSSKLVRGRSLGIFVFLLLIFIGTNIFWWLTRCFGVSDYLFTLWSIPRSLLQLQDNHLCPLKNRICLKQCYSRRISCVGLCVVVRDSIETSEQWLLLTDWKSLRRLKNIRNKELEASLQSLAPTQKMRRSLRPGLSASLDNLNV